MVSRREFVIGLGSSTAASFLEFGCARSSPIRFGYAAITWGGNDLQAINDVGSVGFRGIQLRSPILKDFGERPKELSGLLKQHKLEFVALSGGGPRGNDYDREAEVAAQMKHAHFLRDAGGMFLQMTDSVRPKDGKPASDSYKSLGSLLTEIGNYTNDIGVPMAYHNHMGSLGESPDDVDALMDATDPRSVKLLLDVAHYTQGGGDPVQAIKKYHDRILFLHIKDVETIASTPESSDKYRFVELGRGRVDLPGVFRALAEVQFRGWAIVELDSVPDKARTPIEAATISKKYIEEKLGMKI